MQTQKSVLDDIHSVVSAYVTEDDLKELYEYAASNTHFSLLIDGTGSKIISKKKFDKFLQYD